MEKEKTLKRRLPDIGEDDTIANSNNSSDDGSPDSQRRLPYISDNHAICDEIQYGDE